MAIANSCHTQQSNPNNKTARPKWKWELCLRRLPYQKHNKCNIVWDVMAHKSVTAMQHYEAQMEKVVTLEIKGVDKSNRLALTRGMSIEIKCHIFNLILQVKRLTGIRKR